MMRGRLRTVRWPLVVIVALVCVAWTTVAAQATAAAAGKLTATEQELLLSLVKWLGGIVGSISLAIGTFAVTSFRSLKRAVQKGNAEGATAMSEMENRTNGKLQVIRSRVDSVADSVADSREAFDKKLTTVKMAMVRANPDIHFED